MRKLQIGELLIFKVPFGRTFPTSSVFMALPGLLSFIVELREAPQSRGTGTVTKIGIVYTAENICWKDLLKIN